MMGLFDGTTTPESTDNSSLEGANGNGGEGSVV